MFYAVFDINNGEISSISNIQPDDGNFLEISKESYIDFVQGNVDYGKFLVVPDPKLKGTYILIEKEIDKQEFDVSKSIHEFEKIGKEKIKEDIFYIIQDTKKGKWFARANLGENYIKFLTQTKNFAENTKVIYVTQESNPNILIDSLVIKQEDFLNNKEFFIKDIEHSDSVSLFAGIVHETYKHMIRG